jgi:type VI secretion system protein VasJ
MTMEYANLGKEPIAGDNPAGSDCRYEPDFERLQAEIDKLSSPTAVGKVDWDGVVKKAAHILQAQSKDITVAAYLAVGLLRTQQINGLNLGIQVLGDLVQAHWDGLYPSKKRMRGRRAAINWWLEKTEDALQQIKIDPLPARQIERVRTNLGILDRELVDKLPDPPPLLPVQRLVERLPVRQENAPEIVIPEASPVITAPATAPTPARKAPVPATISNDQEARKGIASALHELRQASHFMLQQDIKDPMAYRYRRLAAWAGLEVSPPHTDGATQIPPPPPQLVSELNAFREAGNWSALILNAEPKVSQYIFWFDLGHLVAESLENLGPAYSPALTVVSQETAYLLQRFPGLADLSFTDGSAFADAGTQSWLQHIGGTRAIETDPAAKETDADEMSFDAVVRQAMAMAGKNQILEAVALLQERMLAATSGSRRMRWRLAIVRALLAVKKKQLALFHIDHILLDIDTFHLEAWDSPLAVEGLSQAFKCFQTQADDAQKQRAMEVLERIATLNPRQALFLQG